MLILYLVSNILSINFYFSDTGLLFRCPILCYTFFGRIASGSCIKPVCSVITPVLPNNASCPLGIINLCIKSILK